MELPYTYWEDKGWFLGYLDSHPNNWTQGKTLKELEEMLLDLHEIFTHDSLQKTPQKKAGKIKVPA